MRVAWCGVTRVGRRFVSNLCYRSRFSLLPDATVCPLANERLVAMAGDEESRGLSVAFDDVTFWKTRGASCLGQSARSDLAVEWRVFPQTA
jgi:hypothetical protein